MSLRVGRICGLARRTAFTHAAEGYLTTSSPPAHHQLTTGARPTPLRCRCFAPSLCPLCPAIAPLPLPRFAALSHPLAPFISPPFESCCLSLLPP